MKAFPCCCKQELVLARLCESTGMLPLFRLESYWEVSAGNTPYMDCAKRKKGVSSAGHQQPPASPGPHWWEHPGRLKGAGQSRLTRLPNISENKAGRNNPALQPQTHLHRYGQCHEGSVPPSQLQIHPSPLVLAEHP